MYLKSMLTTKPIKVMATTVQHLLRCKYTTAHLNLLFLLSNPCHLLKHLLQTHRQANLLVQPHDLQAQLRAR